MSGVRLVRLRRRTVGLLAVGVLVAAGACSDGDSDTPSSPSSTSSTAVVTATTVVTGGTGTTTTAGASATTVGGLPTTAVGAPGEVTIRATVLTVFASARVLQLDPPVNGYSRAALTSETEYRLADGSSGSLQDVDDGSKVEVTGEPGAAGTLIARRVVIVG